MMMMQPLIKRYPQAEILYCGSDMTLEEIYHQVEPYLAWQLLNIDVVGDILICPSSGEEEDSMLILQEEAVWVWFQHHTRSTLVKLGLEQQDDGVPRQNIS